jgi:hypothetical protein
MTKTEQARRAKLSNTLAALGFTATEAQQLRRISNTLQRWYELECGVEGGGIEREEETGRPFWVSSGRKWPTPDREKGALLRLGKIMANHSPLSYYLQTDPRGAALYILRPGDVPNGADPGSFYSRGICVY